MDADADAVEPLDWGVQGARDDRSSPLGIDELVQADELEDRLQPKGTRAAARPQDADTWRPPADGKNAGRGHKTTLVVDQHVRGARARVRACTVQPWLMVCLLAPSLLAPARCAAGCRCKVAQEGARNDYQPRGRGLAALRQRVERTSAAGAASGATPDERCDGRRAVSERHVPTRALCEALGHGEYAPRVAEDATLACCPSPQATHRAACLRNRHGPRCSRSAESYVYDANDSLTSHLATRRRRQPGATTRRAPRRRFIDCRGGRHCHFHPLRIRGDFD